MQGEVTGNHVYRLDEPGARAGHIERVQWACAQAPRHLGRGRGLEVLAGDTPVNQKVDLGHIDAVLEEAGSRRAGRELAGRERLVRVDIADLGVTSAKYVLDALRDRVPFGFRPAEGLADAGQYHFVVDSGVRNDDRRPGQIHTRKLRNSAGFLRHVGPHSVEALLGVAS